MKIIDISQELLSCKVYEGDPAPEAKRIINMEDGGVYNLSALSLCAHNGTHVDAPLHFIKDGKSIEQMSLEHFVGECFVAEHNGNVSAADACEMLKKARILSAEKRILIKGKAIVTEEMTDADKQALIALGYNPDDYYVLDLGMEAAALYVCTGHGKKLTPELAPSNKKIPCSAASEIFTRDQLPVGTIITVASGYEYSPEAWMSYGQRTPQNLAPAKTTATTVVDEAWWGVFQYRAFNLNSLTANTEMSESDLDKLRVYVPKKTPKFEKYSELNEADISVLTAAGKDASQYQVLNLDMMLAAFYKSTNSATIFNGLVYSHTDFPKWMATQIFDKTDLPNGTVISLKSGYEYRPEGWVALDQVNASADRPKNTSETMVVVTEEWWGAFNYRAFNLSRIGDTTSATIESAQNLTIYIPKN